MIRPSRRFYDPKSVQRLLQGLARPAADPEFRSALRSTFSRRLEPERRVHPALRVLRARASRWAAAAAAALIAAAFLNSGPAWQVRGILGTGPIRVDGRVVSPGSPDGVARALHAGARIELPSEAQLDLELPGIAIFQLVGGSRVVLPASPGRWIARAVIGSLEAGEVRVTTGPRFPGSGLTIETPEVRAVVTGTTFAVLRLDAASCVCVYEGAVVMHGPSSARDTVRAGFRRSVFRDGRPPLLEPILPMETMKLRMLHEGAGRGPGR